MCISPIKIKNNRLDYYKGLHVSEIEVPCGHCVECIHERRNELALRAVYETRNWSQFVLLLFTYSPESLPMLCYDGQSMPSHYMPHISVMIDILRRRYGKDKFAYLVGAEFGMDERFTQRPHYHGLFMLDKTIDCDEFTETCRHIWQGEEYYKDDYQSFSWQFGNLGLMLPFKSECEKERKHICRDSADSAAYCAKYCVKQLGFVNKPLVQLIKKNHDLINYRDYVPRMVASRGFGKNMINDKSFSLERNEVYDYHQQRFVSIPKSIVDMVGYVRTFRGRTKDMFDPRTHEPVLDKNGNIKQRRLYDRDMTQALYDAKLKQLPQMIDKKTELWLSLLDSEHEYARPFLRELAIYHYVYKGLPFTALKACGLLGKDIFVKDNYMRAYEVTKLMHDVNVFNVGSCALEYRYDERSDSMQMQSKSDIFKIEAMFSLDMLDAYDYLIQYDRYLHYQQVIDNERKVELSQRLRNLKNPH